MAYDEWLASRLRTLFAKYDNISERKMFGGLAIMTHGHLCVGILGNTLMVRVGPGHYEEALRRPHVRQMDFTGKPMRGYVFVDPEALDTDEELAQWVKVCIEFIATLPPKPRK